jgi:hypothetical protein
VSGSSAGADLPVAGASFVAGRFRAYGPGGFAQAVQAAPRPRTSSKTSQVRVERTPSIAWTLSSTTWRSSWDVEVARDEGDMLDVGDLAQLA